MAGQTAHEFSESGGLSSALSQFEQREGQIALASAIEKVIAEKQHLLAEAGTGIGKTFAYLLPVLKKQKKCLVSTATKHLQDQIFFKDLPIVEKILNKKINACLLKGRSNYLCPYRLEQTLQSSLPLEKTHLQLLQKIDAWSHQTTSGDLSEITTISADDIGLRSRITSTVDNCLGSECPKFDSCFVQKVREKAKKSDLVIVNHALLMADAVLKETGFAEILPDIDVVVIDEAHHLNQVATQAFAEKISSSQLLDLAKDFLNAYHPTASDSSSDSSTTPSKNALSYAKQKRQKSRQSNNNADLINGTDKFENSVSAFIEAVYEFSKALGTYEATGQMLLGQLKRSEHAHQAFKSLMQQFKALLDIATELTPKHEAFKPLLERLQLMAYRIKHIFAHQVSDDESPSASQDSPSVALLEWYPNGFSASKMPIQLGHRFQQVMQQYAQSWIFVSATLAVDQSFAFYRNALGLPAEIETLQVDSPFDYKNHAVIHVMNELPDPRDADFTQAFVAAAVPIIEALKGRTFMLFTSYRALNEAAEWLKKQTRFTLFVQGEQPKTQLIDAFINSQNAILLGTISFWEGVDIQGASLSCVMLDKIPFPSPADPFIQEQANYLKRQGENAFQQCYIPRAATLLKQGTGRLIRSKSDKGVLIIGDKRMLTQSYGTSLINSLPPMQSTDKTGVLQFIHDHLSGTS